MSRSWRSPRGLTTTANRIKAPWRSSWRLEASLIRPKTVVLGHHDNWLGRADFVPVDTSPVRRELSKAAPEADLLEMGYLEAVQVF